MKPFFAFVFFLASITNAIAAPQWWQQVYPSNSNTQITLKDENNNNVTAITNPTAASVKTSVNTSTQSPSIILQATATLPVKVRDAVCDSTKDTVAITSDRAMLLTCQTNIWRANLSQGSLTADGRISGNTVRPTLTAVEGASCATYLSGDQANSASGITLTCQSGVWAKASGTGGGSGGFYSGGNGGYKIETTTLGATCGTHNFCHRINAVTGSCTCPAGKTPVGIASNNTRCSSIASDGNMSVTVYTCE